MFKRIFTAAVLGLAFSFAANEAQAAPIFLLPDVNFASTHSTALTFSGAGARNYILTINTAVGDQMSIDRGTGFSTLANTTLAVDVTGRTGALVLNIGGEVGQSMSATLLTSHVQSTVLGKDIFATWRVTESSIMGFHSGQLIGLDVLGFHVDATSGLAAKGDVAPIVPEPATLSLLLLGLGGLAGVRRKIC